MMNTTLPDVSETSRWYQRKVPGVDDALIEEDIKNAREKSQTERVQCESSSSKNIPHSSGTKKYQVAVSARGTPTSTFQDDVSDDSMFQPKKRQKPKTPIEFI